MSRHRYVYRKHPETGQVESFEVGEDYVSQEVRAPVFTDRYMEGVSATDGTDIGSRRKRAEYMRANNLADADDFKGVWAKAAREREAFFSGKQQDTQRREAVARAMYERKSR
jgi:hypothetical protein